MIHKPGLEEFLAGAAAAPPSDSTLPDSTPSDSPPSVRYASGQADPVASRAGSGSRRRTGRRLLGLLRPSKWRMAGVIAATCAFVTLNVLAPKYLGDATDVVVVSVLGGTFNEAKLAGLLTAVSLMYLGASVFSWIQGALAATAVQRLSYGLRSSVEEKLHVLTSGHFDDQHRGEVLSRATDDVDNISQALNQLLNQLIMSLLMLSAALVMMLWISPALAVIALVSVPVSALITVLVARKSQANFTEQWGEQWGAACAVGGSLHRA
ncbi:ABC-type multidrug transport system fused ATPase/permease subunit [Arthrobacter sp. V4I6]|uniref:ABC transporter transmembrane domain-containing protein n=1 Tax=Arthrobacter sp. V4I6 TaxID=3042281 RepID=UPI0027829894|nr:ABC-type multidrug transport system fused ATPase/permease subunit [Arthrobacter sp. V1I7]MDQ0855407.1 ABC-type multidrug transport system fused ATPase/permease subunit [Arthrobacter sp. V4I6]